MSTCPEHLEELVIEVSKATNGLDYMQIRSRAADPVNIVLIAGQITIHDHRPDRPSSKSKTGKKGGGW